ncbi:MAG: dockerin type I repeat-containing protein [Candidatus Marinimicrobia bacterium]|nr:dockerin type I repeat-containing protein [Candidatus Neomarinimicrobiota bacterium]
MKIVLFGLLIASKIFATDPIFGDRQNWGELSLNDIDEASGLVASQKNENVFWTHNDSGGDPCLYAFNANGEHLGRYYLNGISLRDWEDLTIGPGPIQDSSYLYVGEIGDNSAQYNQKYIYRFIEPTVSAEQQPITTTLSNIETITVIYPDQKRDAETLLIDPWTKDLYIFSKREELNRLYKIPFPQSVTNVITAELVRTIDLYPNQNNNGNQSTWLVAGEMSTDGFEILLKSYEHILYYSREENDSFESAFDQDPISVPYIPETQGEAVAWHPNGFGYFTVSEENNGIPAYLYFYPRTVGCTDSLAQNWNPWAEEDNDSCLYIDSMGDVNQDGQVSLHDVLLSLNFILGLVELDSNQVQVGDMDGNGLINIYDLFLILQNIH